MALSAWPRSRAACGGRRGREAARSRRAARRAACRAASTALREASSTINQEVVLFLMKLDLSTQLQRAITMQSQEAVQLIQQVRARPCARGSLERAMDRAYADLKRIPRSTPPARARVAQTAPRSQNLEEIEQLLQETETTKRANAAGESPNGGLQAGQKQQQEEAVDPVARGLMLRSELQRAIEAEDYPAAARVRDELAKLEAASFASEAAAAVRRSVQASVDLFLGQKVRRVAPLDRTTYHSRVCTLISTQVLTARFDVARACTPHVRARSCTRTKGTAASSAASTGNAARVLNGATR